MNTSNQTRDELIGDPATYSVHRLPSKKETAESLRTTTHRGERLAEQRPLEVTTAATGVVRTSNVTSAMFSSTHDEWGTPQTFFAMLDTEFHFTLDPCATAANAKCERFFSRDDNGLLLPWDGVVYMNPPYGDAIPHWVKKAWDASRQGAVVVCLIPARPDTVYWHVRMSTRFGPGMTI